MDWLLETHFRLRALFQKRRLDAELAAEIQYHVESLAERNVAAGMAPEEARFAAMRLFGHVEGIKEQCREEQGLPWLETLWRDLRHGARLLRRNPAFTAATVLTLAVGLGLSTAIFSIVDHVALRPLPYPDSRQLVSVYESLPPKYLQLPVSPQTFRAWSEPGGVFQESAVTERWPVVVTGAGDASRCMGLRVSPSYFKVMGVPPLLGRTFRLSDGTAGGDDVVILSHRFWLSQFDGRRDVIGQRALVNDRPCRIVGVMPETFRPEEAINPVLFLPLALEADSGPSARARFLTAVARLKPGVTPEEANRELNRTEARMAARDPDSGQRAALNVVSLADTVVGSVRPLLFTLFGAAVFLLLIACVNVANLLLARTTLRQKEIAMRSALGASCGRLVRQLLCESVLISFLGSVLGVGVAYAATKLLLSFGPLPLPRAGEIAMDGATLLFAGGLALLTGLGLGLIPALQAARINLQEAAKDGRRGPDRGSWRVRLRSALVVFEVSLALVLLVGAGLFLRSYQRLRQVPVGFDPGTGVTLVAKPMLFDQRYPTRDRVLAFVDQVTAGLAAVPGVESVALSTSLPFSYMNSRAVTIAGVDGFKPMDMAGVSYYVVTSDYFRTMRIPLARGRWFGAGDTGDSASVAAVSEGFARKYFPGVDPIGRFIQVAGSNAWSEIVGVVADVRERGPAEPAGLQVYEPYTQAPSRYPLLIIRLTQPDPELRAGLRAALDRVDPDVPLPAMANTLDLLLADSISAQRLTLLLFTVFSSVALLLSAIGLYGVMAYSAAQRTQEIGIRMALGAQARDIGWMIFSQSRLVVGVGLALGLVGAWVAARSLGSLLFGADALDPVAFVGAPLLLGVSAFAVCWLPARRATKVDPLVALHEE